MHVLKPPYATTLLRWASLAALTCVVSLAAVGSVEARVATVGLTAPKSVVAGKPCRIVLKVGRRSHGSAVLQTRRGGHWRVASVTPVKPPNVTMYCKTAGRAGQILRLRVLVRRDGRIVGRSADVRIQIRKAIDVKLRSGTLIRTAKQVVSVSGDPNGEQRIVLERGVGAPRVDGTLVMAAGGKFPLGLLGRVVRVEPGSDGRTDVTVVPTTLDRAYSRFRVSVGGTVGALGTETASGQVRTLERAQLSARAAAVSPLGPSFTCSGSGTPSVRVNIDLSKLHFDADFNANVGNPAMSISMIGAVPMSIRASLSGGGSCTSDRALSLRIPLGPTPLVLMIEPAFKLSATGAVTVTYEATAKMTFSFIRSKRGPPQDLRRLRIEGTPSLSGAATLKVYAGLDVGVLLGGAVGISGDFGPEITAKGESRATSSGIQTCVSADSALNVGLNAKAEAFVFGWTYNLAKGSFAQTQVYNKCVPGPGTPGSSGAPGGGPAQPGGGPTRPSGGTGPGGGNAPGGGVRDPGSGGPVSQRTLTGGAYHSCALRDNGQAVCWGYPGDGRLGTGATPYALGPVPVEGINDAVSISAAWSHSCAARANGNVACWGGNVAGQVGDGSIGVNRLAPVTVVGLADATAVSAGDGLTCALRRTGQATCWGHNGSGELGDGTTANRVTPGPVNGLTDAIAVSAGGGRYAGGGQAGGFACALRLGGQVLCWGSNYTGQLGDGTLNDRPSPGVVQGVSDATAISVGYAHSCAVRQDGSVACWGSNYNGQLGDSTKTDRLTPVRVQGLDDATAISVYSTHSCAVRRTGQVVCWGGNHSGHLGDGTTTDHATPSTVLGITDATSVVTGLAYSCSLRRSGQVDCWGSNQHGELGNGTNMDSLVPVSVLGLPE